MILAGTRILKDKEKEKGELRTLAIDKIFHLVKAKVVEQREYLKDKKNFVPSLKSINEHGDTNITFSTLPKVEWNVTVILLGLGIWLFFGFCLMLFFLIGSINSGSAHYSS